MRLASLAASLVVMAFPEDESPLDQTAGTVQTAMAALQDRAIVTGQVHAVRLRQDGFDVLRRVDGDWEPIRALGRDIRAPIRIVLSGDERAEAPLVLLDPTGSPPAGEITLASGTRLRRIELSPSADTQRRPRR